MTHRMSTVFLVVATLGIGILQTSAATRMQQAIVVDPPSLDGPLILTAAARGPAAPAATFQALNSASFPCAVCPYALAFLPDRSILITERRPAADRA